MAEIRDYIKNKTDKRQCGNGDGHNPNQFDRDRTHKLSDTLKSLIPLWCTDV